MRIIAGELRGRKLLAPRTDATRPITDRVKQSLFDILAPLIGGARVYDCFAGTGSMGLECLSREAAHVTFFESDTSALRLLRANIEALAVEDRSAIISSDLFRWFGDPQTTGRADVVFLDPPYRFVRERADTLRNCAEALASRHLGGNGIVVFRHDARDNLELPPLVRRDRREYGSMTIDFLGRHINES